MDERTQEIIAGRMVEGADEEFNPFEAEPTTPTQDWFLYDPFLQQPFLEDPFMPFEGDLVYACCPLILDAQRLSLDL